MSLVLRLCLIESNRHRYSSACGGSLSRLFCCAALTKRTLPLQIAAQKGFPHFAGLGILKPAAQAILRNNPEISARGPLPEQDMWKPTRKEDEKPMPIQEPSSPAPAALAPPTRPSEPLRNEPPRNVDVATIGKSVVVKGELSGSEDLYVDGQVEGSITLRGQSLTIGPNGRVRANVEARNVILHGQVDGNITASDRVELRKSASLRGDIATARIAIDDGAYFKGTIDIQKTEATKVEPKPQAVAPVSTPNVPLSSQPSLLEPKKA